MRHAVVKCLVCRGREEIEYLLYPFSRIYSVLGEVQTSVMSITEVVLYDRDAKKRC